MIVPPPQSPQPAWTQIAPSSTRPEHGLRHDVARSQHNGAITQRTWLDWLLHGVFCVVLVLSHSWNSLIMQGSVVHDDDYILCPGFTRPCMSISNRARAKAACCAWARYRALTLVNQTLGVKCDFAWYGWPSVSSVTFEIYFTFTLVKSQDLQHVVSAVFEFKHSLVWV